MDRIQRNSNQQEQTPQGAQGPTPLPTTYAEPRRRTRQVLDYDDDGQLTILDVPILSPRREPAPVEDAPEEDAPEEAAPAEEVELIPEPQQNVAELAPIAPPPQHHAPYNPQWLYPPQLLNYWYGPQMNQPAYFHQAQGPVVPQYGQLGALEYYDADGNLPGPSNASPALAPPPPPPQQQLFGGYGYEYQAQSAQHFGLAPPPVAPAPGSYGIPIRPEEPSTPQIQAPTPGQYQDPVQASDVVDNWEVYGLGEAVEMEDVDGIEMEEEYEMLDMEEVEEEEVMEEEDVELLSSREEASDGESGNDLELGNFSRIDLDLDLPVNEEQIFQALEDEEEEERKKGEEEEGEEGEEEEGEVILVEDEEEEDLEKEKKKLEQEEDEDEAAREHEHMKKKAEEEEMNQKLIEQLLSQDKLETRVQTLRKRGRRETNKNKRLASDEEKAQEELKKKAQGHKMHEFEEEISNDPNAPEIEQLLRSMGLHYFQARPVVSRRRRYDSDSNDENYDPEENRRPRRKQQVRRRRPNKRQ